jgi:hypothetical protein
MKTKFFIRTNKVSNVAHCYQPWLNNGKDNTRPILEKLNNEPSERDFIYIEVPVSCVKKVYGITRLKKFLDRGIEIWEAPLSPELIEHNKRGL